MAASPSARTSAPTHPAENRLLTIVFAATLAAFIATFNETFLNVGFTHIMANFKIGVPTVQWLATAYMLGADRDPTPQTRHVHGTHGSDDHPRSSWSPSHFWACSTAFPPSSAPSSHSGPHRCGARLDRNTSNHSPPDHKQCRAARGRGFHLGSCRHPGCSADEAGHLLPGTQRHHPPSAAYVRRQANLRHAAAGRRPHPGWFRA